MPCIRCGRSRVASSREFSRGIYRSDRQMEMNVFKLRRTHCGWKVEIRETMRKHSPHSGAKFKGNSVCHSNSDSHPVLRTRAGQRCATDLSGCSSTRGFRSTARTSRRGSRRQPGRARGAESLACSNKGADSSFDSARSAGVTPAFHCRKPAAFLRV